MDNMKEKYINAYHELVRKTLEPYKQSMTEEEFKRFRYNHTVSELLDDYEYTFEEECGYWLEGGNAYQEYMGNCFGQKWYKPEVANELKKICG